jgi:hypothetical protein
MTRQMKNTRTGKIAVYDADLIEAGRWEEYFPPKEKPQAKPKQFKAKGELAVENKESADEGSKPQA